MVNVIRNPSFEEFFTLHPWEFDGDFRIVPDPVPLPPTSYEDFPPPGQFSFEAHSEGTLAQHIGSQYIDPDFPFLAFFYEGIAPLGVTVHYTDGPVGWSRLQADTWNVPEVPDFDGWRIALVPVDTRRPVRRVEITIDATRPRLKLDCFYLDGEGELKTDSGVEPRYRGSVAGTDPRKMSASLRLDSMIRLDAHLFTVEQKLDKILRLLETPGPAGVKVKPPATPRKKATRRKTPKKAAA